MKSKCTIIPHVFAGMVHQFRADGTWRLRVWCIWPPYLKLLWNVLALSHGLTPNLDGIDIVDDPVTDGDRQSEVI